jgi:hypothetical protein
MNERNIVELLCKKLPVEIVVRTNTELQPDLFAREFNQSFVIILNKVNQDNLDAVAKIKTDLLKYNQLNISFEILSIGELKIIKKNKMSFLTAMLMIYLKTNKAEVIFNKNNLIDLSVREVDLVFASKLCSQELVESFRKMFFKAKFVPESINQDVTSQNKIKKIISQQNLIVDLTNSNKDVRSEKNVQGLLSLRPDQIDYDWLNSTFETSNKLHSVVINP